MSKSPSIMACARGSNNIWVSYEGLQDSSHCKINCLEIEYCLGLNKQADENQFLTTDYQGEDMHYQTLSKGKGTTDARDGSDVAHI